MSLPFIQALFLLKLAPIVLPYSTLIPFAPFLVIALSRLSFEKSLLLALACGALIDALSPGAIRGLTPASYACALFALRRLRTLFFIEKGLGLVIATTLFSCIVTLCHLTFIFPEVWSMPSTLVSRLVAAPLLDGLAAFFWFDCPRVVYTWAKRYRQVISWKKTS